MNFKLFQNKKVLLQLGMMVGPKASSTYHWEREAGAWGPAWVIWETLCLKKKNNQPTKEKTTKQSTQLLKNVHGI